MVVVQSQNIWDRCKSELKKKLNPHNYDSWIEPVLYGTFKQKTLTLSVPSTFFIDWIKEHYKGQIVLILEELYGQPVRLDFSVRPRQKPDPVKKAIAPPIKKSPSRAQLREKSNLNEKYTFDKFVVGKSNEFCHASCKAVANKVGVAYNPLFIYGGVGLGKTHLLQAIGNHVLHNKPGANVLYLTSEKFVNSLINSLQKGSMSGFRNKYRNLDLLMVDDIQFIAGKERTQEEFFHTFNALFEMKKQIVITSDKFPKDMKNLEERLRSRFAWGLIADIQPPELEIKIAIIKQIAERNDFNLDEKVAAFLASKIRSNIRELEGCISRVMAYASLTSKRSIWNLLKKP